VWDALRQKKLGVRILLGVVLGLLSVGMLLYLVPNQPGTEVSDTDVVARVGDQTITTNDVQNELNRISRNGQISPALTPLYAQQVLQQLIFQRSLIAEAQRLGIQVTDQEHAERLRQMIPTAYAGDSFIGMDRYTTEVQTRFQMDVPEFENLVKEGLLELKFQQLVTDGVTVTDQEVRDAYRRDNEKIKIDYVIIKPNDLQSKIEATDSELAAYFEKNKAKYAVPDRRTVAYALLDMAQLRQRAQVTEDEMKVYYQAHVDAYKLQDRAHVAHILFKTVGKTDSEIAEIQKKAQEVLNKAKHGANFADLAKQYSEDTTKDKGGDLDWIVRGQTVPEFEAAAFGLPKGAISDLVKTQYGFHIIQVIDRQTARTQTFDEVKAGIETQLRQDRADQLGQTLSNQIADEIRRAGRIPLDELAKKYGMTTGEAKLVEAGQPLPELGSSPEALDAIFRLRVGDVSTPIRTDRGYVVLSVKEILPAHPATLAEVRDRVLADYRQGKAVDLAKTRAEELAKRVKSGEKFDAAAKALGFESKTSDLFARSGSVQDIGNAKLLAAAFSLPLNQVAEPVPVGANWAIYRVVQHDPLNQDEFEKQKKTIQAQVLQEKRQEAFDLFRTELEARLRQEGRLRVYQENMKRFTAPASS
jgi:peptidyl-prolyl cis-trans isomerase D